MQKSTYEDKKKYLPAKEMLIEKSAISKELQEEIDQSQVNKKLNEALERKQQEIKKLKAEILTFAVEKKTLAKQIESLQSSLKSIIQIRDKTIKYLGNNLAVIRQSSRYMVGSLIVRSISRPLPKKIFLLIRRLVTSLRARISKKYKPIQSPALPYKLESYKDVVDKASFQTLGVLNISDSSLTMTPNYSQPMQLKDLRMACILDNFSYDCFKDECHLIAFTPDNWPYILKEKKPHVLFVESSWKGNAGSWQYEQDDELDSLLNWCKQRHIPTIFWNKEDSIHFERFIDTAKKFDYIFTADVNKIDAYIEQLGHYRVYPLFLAAQPKLHIPVTVGIQEQLGTVIPMPNMSEGLKNHLQTLFNDDEYREILSLMRQRFVLSKHTYSHRLRQITDIIGFKNIQPEIEPVIVFSIIKNLEQAKIVYENFIRQEYVDKKLILAINKNFSSYIAEWVKNNGLNINICLLENPANGLINYLKKHRGYYACFTSFNYYGPHFITDLLHGFKYTNADLITKACHYSSVSNELSLNNVQDENMFVSHFLPDASLIKPQLIETLVNQICNPGQENLLLSGYQFYSANKYNFVLGAYEFDGKLKLSPDFFTNRINL